MLQFGKQTGTVKHKEKEDGEKRFIDWEENGAMGH